MLIPRLQHFLEDNHAHFQTIPHPRAITAQEAAAAAHVSGHDLAKTVMVKLDDRLAMVVLPACERVHLGRLRHAVGAQVAELASEAEFRDRFPDCEVGAMPPFGHLYELDVFLDARLAAHDEIAFNAGTHTDLVRMPRGEFEQLARPQRVRLEAVA